MTPEQIAAARALVDAATPGPWLREAQCIYHSNGNGLVASLKAHEWQRDWPTLERDGDFIAWCRDGVPALLDALAAAEARAADLTAKLSPFALLEFETTDEAWDAFYQASGHTWIDYDHIANARAALKAGGGIMSDKTDMISRADAIAAIRKQLGYGNEPWMKGNNSAIAACVATIRALPAAQVADPAQIRDAALQDHIAVHANMLRGTIAMPSVANIIHLYGADVLRSALTITPAPDPAMIREDDGPETLASLTHHLRRMADGQIDAIDSDRLIRAAALIPTPPAVSDDVAALVDALQHMVNHATWREQNEGVFWEATGLARAALANLKGGAE